MNEHSSTLQIYFIYIVINKGNQYKVVLRYSFSIYSCSKEIGNEGVFEGFQLANHITYLILESQFLRYRPWKVLVGWVGINEMRYE